MNFDGRFLDFELRPVETISLENDGSERIPLRLRGLGIKRNRHPGSLFLGTPLVAEVAGEPILCIGEIYVPGMAFANCHRHIEFAHGVFRLLVEIALAKQMATA